MKTKAILAFDVDGTLTERNTEVILPTKLSPLLKDLSDLGYVFIPVTGKPSAYAMRIIKINKLAQNGVIAENAGVYIKPGDTNPEIYGPNIDAIFKLRQLVGLKPDDKGITKIILDDKETETVIDPEDISIFTIFTDANSVKHKWKYNPILTTDQVFNTLNKLIVENSLSSELQLLPPFPDGGIQIIRMDQDGTHPIDKSSLPKVIDLMYPHDDILPITMFGDGHNDIPAMSPDRVTPITFNNAETVVKDFVRQKGGYISNFDAVNDIGIVDGIAWLLKFKDFFGEDNLKVSELIKNYFPEAKLF